MIDYEFHPDAPEPWAHQRAAVLEHGDKPAFAFNLDTRTGKTRCAIDTAVYRYEKGDIDAMLVVAFPSGVPRVWIEEELPAYTPPRVAWRGLLWRAGSQALRGWNDRYEALLGFNGLAVFAANAEALSGKGAAVRRYLTRFLNKRRVFLVIDECDAFAVPGAARSRYMTLLSRNNNIKVKRILSATMITESPFDAYSQYNLLDRKILGCPTFLAFKHRYAEYESEWDPKTNSVQLKMGYNHRTNTQYEIITRDQDGRPKYKNLDDLQRRIAPYTMRVRREDVSDAPPKIYQKRYFDLGAEQARVYRDLRDSYIAELDNGAVWTARDVMVRLTMLQQITSNFLPAREEGRICPECKGMAILDTDSVCEACEGTGTVIVDVPLHRLGEQDPRLEALKSELNQSRCSAVVWARFTAEVDAICKLFPGSRTVRFDGKVGEKERAEGRAAFQAGEADLIVGNQIAGGRGLRMDRAALMVFYSNSYSLRARSQAEDRAEAIGKKFSTGIVDLIAEGTVDEKIYKTLHAKRDLVSTLNGDQMRGILR